MMSMRLLIPAILGLSLTSCVEYWKQRDSVQKNKAGPVLAPIDPNDREYERYGIPPEGQRGQDGTARVKSQLRNYPLAEKTNNPNEVISPFPPNRRIDVGGMESGQLAKDPHTGKIFLVP